MRNHVNILSSLRAAGEKNWYDGAGEGRIMVGQTSMKKMKAGEIFVYTYEIFMFKRVKIAKVLILKD